MSLNSNSSSIILSNVSAGNFVHFLGGGGRNDTILLSYFFGFYIHIPHILGRLFISARSNFFWGEARSTKGGLIREVAAWGVPGAEPPDAGEVFKKFAKNFKEISRFFQKSFSNFIEFLAKIWSKI